MPGSDHGGSRERGGSAGSFDAASELAIHLPVTVVSELIGLPEAGQERMLVWAEEMFNASAR